MSFRFFLFCTYILLYILYMMTSLGGDRARGTREKVLPTSTQTTQPQKQLQVHTKGSCQYISTCWPNELRVLNLSFLIYVCILILVVSRYFFQATAEQIRLAQMIYDKNDADFEDKVNQVRHGFIFKPSFFTLTTENGEKAF